MANLFNGVDGAGKTEIGVPGVPGVGIELFGLGEKKINNRLLTRWGFRIRRCF